MIKILLTHFFRELFSVRKKPLVIQLPVTSRCNSRCLTCNVWKNKEGTDIDPKKLETVFSDPYLSQVEVVGINGGEISLYKDVDDLIQAVLTLPRLKSVYIISNGLLKERLMAVLKHWKDACKGRGVKVIITLSVDGVNEVHNKIRGVPTGFKRTLDTLEAILEGREHYCDEVRVGCTLSKYNMAYLPEIEVMLAKYKVAVEYHLAVPNKRIGTFEEAPYSVLEDEESRLLAAGFFLGKSIKSRKISEKFIYFSNYYYLLNHGKGRLFSCPYQKRDLTIDEKMNLYLCATASERIANLAEVSIGEAMHSKRLKKVESEVFACCDTCIHYNNALPTLKGMFCFVSYLVRNRYIWKLKFKLLAKW